MRALIASAALTAALLQGSWPTVGQSGGPVPAADSARIVRAARSAQSAFESFRRNRLPFGARSGSSCEVRIGRYCYWRGDDDDDRDPPTEAPAIRERREALIATLDSASQALRGDAWLAGQHVRYLVEAERTDAALVFARDDCHSSPSWCAALAGYAAHAGGRFAVADSAFANALAAMEPAERCHWLDITDLVDDDLARRLEALDCAARVELARRVFQLGAPLYSVSRTDLLTEHLARVTRAIIAEHAATIDGEPWADDERQLMVRYGWPRWYSRTQPEFGSQSRPSITGHDRGLPYDFLPDLRVVDHAGRATLDDWHLDDPRARTGYAPSYARSVHDVPHQIASFRRGESTLVVAAWDARRDTTLLGRHLDAALVVVDGGEQRAITRRTNERVTGHISATGVIDSGLVSLELLAAEDRRAGRARVGVPARAAGRVALSDLLLYSPTGEAPLTLDPVRDSALTTEVVPSSRVLGVYWETYGLRPQGEPVHVTLNVEQIEISLMRRAAERFHLVDPTTGLRIQWEEVPQQANGIAGRGVRVDLSRLRSGRYRLQVTVEAAGETPVVAMREIEVR